MSVLLTIVKRQENLHQTVFRSMIENARFVRSTVSLGTGAGAGAGAGAGVWLLNRFEIGQRL